MRTETEKPNNSAPSEGTSFSQHTKDELCGNLPKSACCRRALLYGLLLFRQMQQPGVVALLQKLEHEFRSKMDDGVTDIHEIFTCENCRRCFLRGVFLSCGSVTDPMSSYHLDILLPDGESAVTVAEITSDLGVPARRSTRRGAPLLYCIGMEQVSDFLVAIGAQNAALTLMNQTIVKEFRNRANRERNCDSANIHKTVNACAEQIELIARLRQSGRFSAMAEELRYTAELREKNPDAPMGVLASIHEPPISKSGVSHRFKKMERIDRDEE